MSEIPIFNMCASVGSYNPSLCSLTEEDIRNLLHGNNEFDGDGIGAPPKLILKARTEYDGFRYVLLIYKGRPNDVYKGKVENTEFRKMLNGITTSAKRGKYYYIVKRDKHGKILGLKKGDDFLIWLFPSMWKSMYGPDYVNKLKGMK